MAMSIVAVTISDRLQVLIHRLLRPKRSITAWIIFKCSTTFSVPFMGLSSNRREGIMQVVLCMSRALPGITSLI